MNDAKEVQHALELAERAIESLLAKNEERAGGRFTAADLQAILSDLSTLPRIFTTSFSEHGDLLSQWRAYCPPSGGCALGFDFKRLDRALETHSFTLAPCIYDPVFQNPFVEHIVSATVTPSEVRLDSKSDNLWHKASFVSDIADLAPFLKHPSFAEEFEWRVIPAPPSSLRRLATIAGHGGLPREPESMATFLGMDKLDCQFREGRSTLIPYIQVPFGDNEGHALTEVVIGPNRYPKLAMEAIRNLLDQEKLNHVTTRLSECPYRQI